MTQENDTLISNDYYMYLVAIEIIPKYLNLMPEVHY